MTTRSPGRRRGFPGEPLVADDGGEECGEQAERGQGSGGGEQRHAAQPGERRFRAQPVRVDSGGDQHLAGGVHADAGQGNQLWGHGRHQRCQVRI